MAYTQKCNPFKMRKTTKGAGRTFRSTEEERWHDV